MEPYNVCHTKSLIQYHQSIQSSFVKYEIKGIIWKRHFSRIHFHDYLKKVSTFHFWEINFIKIIHFLNNNIRYVNIDNVYKITFIHLFGKFFIIRVILEFPQPTIRMFLSIWTYLVINGFNSSQPTYQSKKPSVLF